jgi:hypothetical protein
MIARRTGQDSRFPLGVRERADEIDPTPNLESAGRLMILVFQ